MPPAHAPREPTATWSRIASHPTSPRPSPGRSAPRAALLRLVGLEANRRISLDLLDQRDLPREVLARVLFVVAAVVVGLVPDIVHSGGGALDAGLPLALPRGVTA